jgi:hypothetical protein
VKVNQAVAEAGLQQVVQKMPPLELSTLEKLNAGANLPPGLRCAAILSLYEKATQLPQRSRTETLRALLTS